MVAALTTVHVDKQEQQQKLLKAGKNISKGATGFSSEGVGREGCWSYGPGERGLSISLERKFYF